MEVDNSENHVILAGGFCCAKDCKNPAPRFFKITVACMGGWFCDDCASELEQLELITEVER